MTSPESPVPLPERLREAIAERGVSQRQLARELAGPDADDRRVENERRQLGKYLSGQHAPTVARARLLAELLGKQADYFIEPSTARARLVEQIRSMGDLLLELRSAVDDAALDELSTGFQDLVGRLRSLEDTVESQGRSMTLALEALTEGIHQLERQLEAGAGQAKPTRRRAQ